MTWVGGIAVGMFVLGAIVYFFGRRSADKLSQRMRWRIWPSSISRKPKPQPEGA